MQAVRVQAARARVISVFGAVAVAVVSMAFGAAPASAANSPSSARVGCATDSSCMVELSWNVAYSGSSGGHNGVVIPPPPCIGVPYGDAHTGSEGIIALYSNTAPVASPAASPAPTWSDSGSAWPSDTASPSGTVSPADTMVPPAPAASPTPTAALAVLSAAQQHVLDQARQLAGSNPIAPGEWYQIAGNPFATSAAQRKCTNLPPFIWAAGSNGLLRVDGLNIPLRTLAGLAYAQLRTAQLGKVTLNPRGPSDTNLPTFLDVTLQPPPRGLLSVTPAGDPYIWTTAVTPAGESATVWAWVTGLTISPGTASAKTWNQQRCSVAHLSADGHTFMLGSRYSKAEMAQVGPGQQIDCGVTYTAPGTYAMTASITWNACWKPGLATPGGPPAGCRPVPGAAGLAPSTTAPVQVQVRDIQSVTNG